MYKSHLKSRNFAKNSIMWRALAILALISMGLSGQVPAQLITATFNIPADTSQHALTTKTIDAAEAVALTDTLTSKSFAGNTAVLYGGQHMLMPRQEEDRVSLAPIPRKKEEDWKILFFLGGLGAIAAARFFYAARIWHFFKAASGSNFFNQMEREGGFFDELVTYLLFFNFLVVFSLLIWQTALFFAPDISTGNLEPLTLFLILLAATLAFYTIKSMMLSLLGWVFNTRHSTQGYLKNLFLFNQLMGLALLPAVGYLVYSPSLTGMIIIWGFWLVASLVKVFRGAMIGYSQLPYSGYYLFLYLCSVELVPVLLIIKFGSKYLLIS